ncbi:MAG: hypothetical protein ACI8P0_004597 [Planctomycetaceae bacterium]|jgi:hypothetical protein
MTAESTTDRLVVVFQVNEPLRAEIMKASLEGAGIECQLANGHQGNFAGIDIVPVELSVRASDVERARVIIGAHEQANDA